MFLPQEIQDVATAMIVSARVENTFFSIKVKAVNSCVMTWFLVPTFESHTTVSRPNRPKCGMRILPRRNVASVSSDAIFSFGSSLRLHPRTRRPDI